MKYFFCLIILALYVRLDAQEINRQVNLPKLVPASPEAAALGKFGQIPVSNYRGIPNISIPMFTITEGDISVPIALDYHAGGIKVEEVASRAGLGWALKAGGVITRSLKGLPDESGYMLNGDKARKYSNNGMTYTEHVDYALGILRGEIDGEPDIFYYNFGDVSGKFFITDSGMFVTSPRSDIRIRKNNDGWILTTGVGINYYFYEKEITASTAYCRSFSSAYTDNETNTLVSAWFLTKIVDVHGNTVTFNYTNPTINYQTKATETRNVLWGLWFSTLGYPDAICPSSFQSCYNQVTVNSKCLTDIAFSNGKVVFENDTASRLDDGGYGILKNASMYAGNKLVNTFRFYSSYFSTVGNTACAAGYRLRLDSLQEVGTKGAYKQPYRFVYNATSLPCRMSNDQDYYGYYNGKGNTEFVRYKTLKNGPWQGANKEVDSVYAKAGVLEKLVYPTGGYTRFNYESNQFSQHIDAGFDLTDPKPLSFLWGSNASHGGSYLVNFSPVVFTISNADVSPVDGYAYVTGVVNRYIADPNVLNIFTSTITGPSGYSRVINNGDTLLLVPGTYTLHGSIETEFAGTPYGEESITLTRFPYKSERYKTVLFGGLRVRTVDDYNESNQLAETKRFLYKNINNPHLPDSVSSGEFSGFPADESNFSYEARIGGTPGTPNAEDYCTFMVFNGMSNYPLIGGSSLIGYRNVTIFYGPSGANGKEEFTYTSHGDFPDVLGLTPPFFFATEFDWRKGLLLQQDSYAYQPAGYRLVQSKRVNYDFHPYDTTRKFAWAVKVGKNIMYSASLTNIGAFDMVGINSVSYRQEAEGFNIKADTTYLYDDLLTTGTISTVNGYSYSPDNFQLKRKVSIDSKQHVSTLNYLYAKDYLPGSGPGRGKFVAMLRDSNMISVPVEEYTTSIIAGNEYILNGRITSYKVGKPFVDTVYTFESRGPLLSSSFQQSTVDGGNNFLFHTTYRPSLSYNRFLNSGKPVELLQRGNLKHVYLWDYQAQYLAAEVVNADSVDVAYTSFEADASGNWTIGSSLRDSSTALTGRRCYSLSNGSISKAVTIGKTYTLVYWSKNGSFTLSGASGSAAAGVTVQGWTCYTTLLTTTGSTLTISGSGYIDELRLCPEGATMKTFTYSPLVGITSQCDDKNNLLYYEYDGLNRLLRVRDKDNYIIKQLDYKYEAAIRYYSVAKSVTKTRQVCGVGATPGDATYTIAAGSYTSVISQADADQQALDAANAGAQEYANTNGSCTWYSISKSGTYTRNNCGSGYTGGSYTYTVAAGTYSSTVDQTTADGLAQTDVDNNGQNAANTYGSCTPVSACSPACNTPQQKCISGVCRRGIQVFTGCSYYGVNQYVYTFHYEYPDGTWSGTLQQITSTPCN